MIPDVAKKLNDMNSLGEYVKYITAEKDNILLHAMKLFYYIHNTCIHDKIYTIRHWTDEVTSYFNIRYLNILHGDSLPSDIARRMTVELINNADIGKGLMSLTSHMVDKSRKDRPKPHELPYLEFSFLYKRLPRFIKFYNKFMEDLISRILDDASNLNLDMLVKYVTYCAKANNDLKLVGAANKYHNFSSFQSNFNNFIIKNINKNELRKLLKDYN